MGTQNSEFSGSYIDGQFVRASTGAHHTLSADPGDLDKTAIVCDYDFDAVAQAVSAAQRSFRKWARTDLKERYAALDRYRQILHKNRTALATEITTETGRPLWETLSEVDQTDALIEYWLGAPNNLPTGYMIEEPAPDVTATVNYRPRGVFGVIAPAILPLLDSHSHWIPCLLSGNTVVIKSSRYTPLFSQLVARAVHASGLPPGVFNMIHGDSEIASRLAREPGLRGIFFTGSYETSLQLKKQTLADYDKLIVLEMPGRNSALVWSDCNYAQALQQTLLASLLSSGQRRYTTNRLLVHHSIFDRFLDDFHRLAKACRVGHGLDRSDNPPFMGPLISQAALDNYIKMQGIAVREGCEEIMRGKHLERSTRGHYVSPSIHCVPKLGYQSVYQRSEVFGPNIALYQVHDIEEALEIINLPQYGLAASVHTCDNAVFEKLCSEAMVGTVYLNGPTTSNIPSIPQLGLKKSGNHRAMGGLTAKQCSYPVTALEFRGSFDAGTLPDALPRLQ